jgi:hypothetical protein
MTTFACSSLGYLFHALRLQELKILSTNLNTTYITYCYPLLNEKEKKYCYRNSILTTIQKSENSDMLSVEIITTKLDKYCTIKETPLY